MTFSWGELSRDYINGIRTSDEMRKKYGIPCDVPVFGSFAYYGYVRIERFFNVLEGAKRYHKETGKSDLFGLAKAACTESNLHFQSVVFILSNLMKAGWEVDTDTDVN